MTQRNGSPVDIEFFFIRSEEHTSELQSHSDLVCRLLLEKKKTSCREDRKSTRINSSHTVISYAVFCLKKNTTSLDMIYQVTLYAKSSTKYSINLKLRFS